VCTEYYCYSETTSSSILQLRLMHSELVVEDVVRDRSMKVGPPMLSYPAFPAQIFLHFVEMLEGKSGRILYMRWCHCDVTSTGSKADDTTECLSSTLFSMCELENQD